MKTEWNPKLIGIARNLRRNMTKEEKHLWYDFLRDYPIRFRRQEIIGNYIADFYCDKAKLIVELDGSQHYAEENMREDADRTACFNGLGIEVIRFSNLDVVRNFEGVCTAIMQKADTHLSG
jgi:very-short-patch-repair endonuclease